MAAEEQQAFGGKNDPLYEQAVALVSEKKRSSVSMIQRHLRIGYTRASLMLEAMAGTVISEFSPKAKVLS